MVVIPLSPVSFGDKKLVRVVAIGDAAAIKESLGKLGLGAVTITKAPRPAKATLAVTVGEPRRVDLPKTK